MKIFAGTSGYAYKEWKGKFYPEKISSKEMLPFYSERLDTVEINNTFYRMPTESLLSSWAEQTPEDFLFAIKAPQIITHIRRLRNVNEEVEYFFRTLSILGNKLGPVLFQFPKNFRADRELLEEFLALIRGEVPCAFEFRNESWLEPGILDLLNKKKFSLCTADSDENPAEEIVSTSNWGYLRLRRSDYTEAGLSRWMEKVLSQKWKRAFVFFKHEGDAKGAEMAMLFRKLADSAEKEKTIR